MGTKRGYMQNTAFWFEVTTQQQGTFFFSWEDFRSSKGEVGREVGIQLHVHVPRERKGRDDAAHKRDNIAKYNVYPPTATLTKRASHKI